MLRHKAQQKSVRQTEGRHERNVTQKSAAKTIVKRAISTIGSAGEAQNLRLAQKAIDKLESHGVIHKNTSARRKSRLMKKTNKTKFKQA